jgi:nicotinic acid mononucleotide adenylyltransferase/Icc-related predicted phosphoesterase
MERATVTLRHKHCNQIPATTTIVHISDTHGKDYDHLIPPGDILIHSGDFTHRGKPEETLKFASFLSRQPHRHKVVVCGNHEWGYDQLEHSQLHTILGEGVIILQDEAVTIDGIKFWGSSWNNSAQAWGLSSSEREKKWELIPSDTDVLITHNPPYGILDLAWEHTLRSEGVCPQCGKIHPRFSHWGDRALAAAIVTRQIPLHLFGHVHDEVGILTIGDTTYSNASMDISKIVNVIKVLPSPLPPAPLPPPTTDWPITKLISRTEEANSTPRLPRAVLLMTGALNPIHRGHVNNMELARASLESRGFFVLGGFLSPSSDLYVSRKMQSQHARLLAKKDQPVPSSVNSLYSSAAHRLKMTHLACDGSDWLAEAAWESNQHSFVDFPEVLDNLEALLWENRFFEQPGDTVVYVCGSDHFRHCSLQGGVRTRGGSCPVIVCTREKDDLLMPQPFDRSLVSVLSSQSTSLEGNEATDAMGFDDLSSTLIRSLLYGAIDPTMSCPELRSLLPPLVGDYLLSGEGKQLYREQIDTDSTF